MAKRPASLLVLMSIFLRSAVNQTVVCAAVVFSMMTYTSALAQDIQLPLEEVEDSSLRTTALGAVVSVSISI